MALHGGYVTVLTWHPAARAPRARGRARDRSPLLHPLVSKKLKGGGIGPRPSVTGVVAHVIGVVAVSLGWLHLSLGYVSMSLGCVSVSLGCVLSH